MPSANRFGWTVAPTTRTALVDDAEDHRDEYQSCDWRRSGSLLEDLKYPKQFTIEVNPHASPSPPVHIAGVI